MEKSRQVSRDRELLHACSFKIFFIAYDGLTLDVLMSTNRPNWEGFLQQISEPFHRERIDFKILFVHNRPISIF